MSNECFKCGSPRESCIHMTESQNTEIRMSSHSFQASETQYWLAELDQYGNPKLIDGAYDTAQGANQAAYLIRAMGLLPVDRRFSVAKVVLTECKPSAEGVNLEAVRTINAAKAGLA